MKMFFCLTWFGCIMLSTSPFKHNPIFDSYLTDFELESEIQGRYVSTSRVIVNFGNMPKETTIGFCKMDKTNPEIHIRKLFWVNASESERQLLIFHELGHCLLNLDHDDTHNNIMTSDIIDEKIYLQNRSKLLKLLFKGSDRFITGVE